MPRHSAAWAWQIPLAAAPGCGRRQGAAGLQSLAKRLGGLSVSDVLGAPTTASSSTCGPSTATTSPADAAPAAVQPPVLVPSRRGAGRGGALDVADGYRPLIAVGKPGGRPETAGGIAYRAYLADSAWQDYVADKIRPAERIVLVMKNSEGVRWEIARVVAEGAATQDPVPVRPGAERRRPNGRCSRACSCRCCMAPPSRPRVSPSRTADRLLLPGRGLVEIVNENRTATSYRTAFFALPGGDEANGSDLPDRPEASVIGRVRWPPSSP